jgi:hypothetical protein
MMTKHRMKAADRKLLVTQTLQGEGRWEEAAVMAEKMRSSVAKSVSESPVRQGANGVEVDLRPLFAAWESGPFRELTAALQKQDAQRSKRAVASLKQQCASCHLVLGRNDIQMIGWNHP